VDTVVRERNADFSEGTVSLRVSANGRAVMGAEWGTPVLLAEAIAQSALLLQGEDPDLGRRGFLAGLDGLELARAPLAGETLLVDVKLAGRFGAMAKFDGVVRSGEETIASGSILVRKGE